MTMQRLAKGKQGEELAATFLKNKGLKIIARNVRLKSGEIDIIARADDTLVFVEVKTRSSTAFGSPLEAVDARKMRQVSRAAQEYLIRNGGHDQAMRFDVVGILLGADIDIEHIENAFDLL